MQTSTGYARGKAVMNPPTDVSVPLYPGRLRPGDTLAVVAPASPFDRRLLERGREVLHTLGYRTVEAPGLFNKEGFLAGSDRQRAEQVERCLSDPGVQALICARGGYGSLRVLEHLDFAQVRAHPKLVIGFSDISALLYALYRRCGLVSLHGPTVTTLATADRESVESLGAALAGGQPLRLEAPEGRVLQGGTAVGPVAGGNLTVLCHLAGTPDSPRFGGHILVLEDRGEAPYRIDRMLTHLRLAGCFEGLAGLALGAFDECGPSAEIEGLFADAFRASGIPILAGLEVGHGPRNRSFPLGVTATLDTGRSVLEFHRAAGGA